MVGLTTALTWNATRLGNRGGFVRPRFRAYRATAAPTGTLHWQCSTVAMASLLRPRKAEAVKVEVKVTSLELSGDAPSVKKLCVEVELPGDLQVAALGDARSQGWRGNVQAAVCGLARPSFDEEAAQGDGRGAADSG